MKRHDLLKALGITLLVVVLLSWCVKTGVYSSGSFVSLEQTAPIGILDILRLPFMTMTIPQFVQFGLFILAVGGFYGVLNKTTAYGKLVDKVAKLNKEKVLTVTIILFALLASLAGDIKFLIILVPFFIAVLLKQGYDRMATFAATIGSILVGQIGTTLGFGVWGLLKYIFSIKMTDLMVVRIIFLAVILTLYVLTIRKYINIQPKKKSKKETINEEIPLYESVASKKSYIPLVVVSLISIVIILIGTYNWSIAYGTSIFEHIYTSINEFKLGGYLLFHNLLGSMSEIGSFTNYDVIIILIVTSLIIGWIYSLKFVDILASFIDGCKVMIKPAIYAVLVNVVITAVVVLYSQNGVNGNFIMTMVDKFTTGTNISVIGTMGTGLVMGTTYTDFYTFLASVQPAYGIFDSTTQPVVAFIFQAMYGLAMLLAPTSILLFPGLSYLDVKYKEWLKYIWKYALVVLGFTFVIASIITNL